MKEVFDLVNEMSPYLLLGFLLAGIMHAFIPGSVYSRYLAGNNFRSVFFSALFGVPLPLCSCGVIPTAMSLRREGASKGATVSFLIATPQTGVDSIIATYSLMGLPFAIVRPIAALFTALFGGQLVNLFESKDEVRVEFTSTAKREKGKTSFAAKVKEALRYAFVDMMQDIGKWLVVGLIVAGLITVFLPNDFFGSFADRPIIGMLIVLAFAIPMYICATGSIPIAVALMMKGLTPGAALVLLMAGPAANAASILVINKVLGKRTLVLYLFSIILGAMLFGLGIDYFLPREWFTVTLLAAKDCCGDMPNYFNIGCTVLLGVLLINALVLRYRHPHAHCHCGCGDEETCGCEGGENGACECGHQSEADTVRVFHISGMTCNHCRANVEKVIASLPGVKEVSVDLASTEARLAGDVTDEEVRKAVESIGFSVKD